MMNSKQLYNNKKKAFTLIELLIVIAIIGILFIVLVSKVDFATDKAKATGVQTDFRSFQMAFDTVAKENAGFNTFGYNTGDNAGAIPDGYTFESTEAENKTKGDGIRNSYDQGDKNLNGKQDGTEVWTGRKVYTETWTEVYTMVHPGDANDTSAFVALENAINSNLDPKLHITITPEVDGTTLTGNATITMANQARDPWKNEYHGAFITNSVTDGGADRGAIVMYSNGANGKWGSAHDITNGVVTVTVPGNNVNGKDDMSFVSCYTFVNGYGEVLNSTTGFSNNQSFNSNTSNAPAVVPGGNNTPSEPSETEVSIIGWNFDNSNSWSLMEFSIPDMTVSDVIEVKIDAEIVDSNVYTVLEGYNGIDIVFDLSYTQSLSDQEHTIKVVLSDNRFATKLFEVFTTGCDHTMSTTYLPEFRNAYSHYCVASCEHCYSAYYYSIELHDSNCDAEHCQMNFNP